MSSDHTNVLLRICCEMASEADGYTGFCWCCTDVYNYCFALLEYEPSVYFRIIRTFNTFNLFKFHLLIYSFIYFLFMRFKGFLQESLNTATSKTSEL